MATNKEEIINTTNPEAYELARLDMLNDFSMDTELPPPADIGDAFSGNNIGPGDSEYQGVGSGPADLLVAQNHIPQNQKLVSGGVSVPLRNEYNEIVDPMGALTAEEQLKIEGDVLKNQKVVAEIDKINNVSRYYRGQGLKPEIDKNGNVFTTTDGVRQMLYISPVDQIVKTTAGDIIFQKGVDPNASVNTGVSNDTFKPGTGPTFLKKQSSGSGFPGGVNPNISGTFVLGPGGGDGKYPPNFHDANLAGTLLPHNIEMKRQYVVDKNGNLTDKIETVLASSESTKAWSNTIDKLISMNRVKVDKKLAESNIEGLQLNPDGGINYNFPAPAIVNFERNYKGYEYVRKEFVNNPDWDSHTSIVAPYLQSYTLGVYKIDKDASYYRQNPADERWHQFIGGDNVMADNGNIWNAVLYTTDVYGDVIQVEEIVAGNITKVYQGDEAKSYKPKK